MSSSFSLVRHKFIYPFSHNLYFRIAVSGRSAFAFVKFDNTEAPARAVFQEVCFNCRSSDEISDLISLQAQSLA